MHNQDLDYDYDQDISQFLNYSVYIFMTNNLVIMKSSLRTEPLVIQLKGNEAAVN